jgi:hypothetical protein
LDTATGEAYHQLKTHPANKALFVQANKTSACVLSFWMAAGKEGKQMGVPQDDFVQRVTALLDDIQVRLRWIIEW